MYKLIRFPLLSPQSVLPNVTSYMILNKVSWDLSLRARFQAVYCGIFKTTPLIQVIVKVR